MAEVEAATVFVNIRTCLMYVVAENFAECFLEKVAGGMVTLGCVADGFGKSCADVVAHFDMAGTHYADVHGLAAGGRFFTIGYVEDGRTGSDGTSVANLAAHFRIERSGIKDDNSFFAFFKFGNKFAVFKNCKNFGSGIHSVITDKFGFYVAESRKAVLNPGNAVCRSSCVACAFFLVVHKNGEAFNINGDVFIFKDILGKVKREAVGIVKFECNVAGKNGFASFFKFCNVIVKKFKALVNGAAESFLFGKDNFFDIVCVLCKFRICNAVFFDYGINYFVDEGFVDSKKSAVTGGSSEKAFKNVSAAFVCRHNAVADDEGGGTDMVGDYAERNVFNGVIVIFNAGNFADFFHDVLNGVNLEKVINALHYACKSFKAHTGIDVRVFHAFIVAFAVGIELGENKVPDFDETVAITSNGAVGASAAMFNAAVKINFGAGSAGTGTDFPEVILFSETENAVFGKADYVVPNIISLVVVLINGDVEFIFRKFDNFGKIFPSPRNNFFFEVVSEGEVTEHFEISSVAVVLTNVVDIGGTDAFLAGGYSVARGFFLAKEPFFHRCHTGVDEKKALIIFGEKGKAGKPFVTFAFKKAEEAFADVIYAHPFHVYIIPFN